MLDRVADTLALGDPAAAKLHGRGSRPNAPAPIKVPEVFKDAKASVFFRANLGLAYARACPIAASTRSRSTSSRSSAPSRWSIPAAYLFHRAVASTPCCSKDEATATITRLLEDAADTPGALQDPVGA